MIAFIFYCMFLEMIKACIIARIGILDSVLVITSVNKYVSTFTMSYKIDIYPYITFHLAQMCVLCSSPGRSLHLSVCCTF